jgi:hypothetical protein
MRISLKIDKKLWEQFRVLLKGKKPRKEIEELIRKEVERCYT